jgi:hypothetical protein
MKWLFYFCIGLFISAGQPLYAQLGSWNFLNVRTQVHPDMNAWGELQVRSMGLYRQFHYYELKAGLSYTVNDHFSVLLGTGMYSTYKAGEIFSEKLLQQREFRTWLEMTSRQEFNYLNFEHRVRIEQRFTQKGFRHRMRYRIGAIVPLNNATLKSKTVYLTAWNEIFFTNINPFFERDRMFVGLGYKLGHYTLQGGYGYQFDYRVTDELGREFFLVSMVINIGKEKHRIKHLPLEEH